MDREGLSPLDEARLFETMIDKGLAKTNEELSALLQQNITRIKRLRRLGAGPRIVKDAIGVGLMVAVSVDADGKEARELRRLDQMAAIAFVRLHEHLKKTQPKKAEDRLERAVRRALAGNWSVKRTEDHVDRVMNGGEDEPATGKLEPSTPAAEGLFTKTSRRFVVDLARLKAASDEQLAALKAAMAQLVTREPEPGSP